MKPYISRIRRQDKVITNNAPSAVHDLPTQKASSHSTEVVNTTRKDSMPSGFTEKQITITCTEQCDCICHRGNRAKIPKFALGVVGPLTIVYKGSSPVKTCSSHSCSISTLRLSFVCPRWLANFGWECILNIDTPRGSIIRANRLVSENGPIFWAVRTGASNHVRRLFVLGKVSVRDTSYPEGKTILHVRLSRETLKGTGIDWNHRLQWNL